MWFTDNMHWFIYYLKILSYITRNAFHYYFYYLNIRLLGSSVDHDLVAMTSELMVPHRILILVWIEVTSYDLV